MSLIEDANQFLVGRVGFPAINYLMNRKDIARRYRELQSSEYESKDAVKKMQFQKLSVILQRAYSWIPFYTKRFKEIGLVPEDIRSLEDLQRIPPLDRRDLIENRLDLLDFRFRDSALAADHAGQAPGLPFLFGRYRKHKLIRNSSTGSTGTPTVFYEDGSTTSMNWVHEQRLKHWFGIAPGAKEARMKGISAKYHTKRFARFIRECAWNQQILPGASLSDHEYELCLRKLRNFRPHVLWGATPALMGLAEYVQRTHCQISPWRPKLIISWAAPLYSHEKNILGEVFGCPLTNLYGTREVGHVAMVCPHNSIHVNHENYLVEIEGAGLEGGASGPGHILITPLYDSPMPFLRYRIGDVAELGSGVCPCGRSLPVLKKILGRIGEVFRTSQGRLIEPTFWCLAFMSGRPARDVVKFQIVYRAVDLIRFRIVRGSGYSAETEAELLRAVESAFPPSTQFEFEYVREIKPKASGKYEIVVNEMAKQPENLVHA